MPKVSILCITYNHEKFIDQALDSFVMQKTNFDFEVVIGDDNSQDNTQKIIAEYAAKYPNIIKPVLRKQNIGGTNNFIDIASRIKSEYVANCEGDDYFTDPLKLQKQVDFLEKHRDCSICFHTAKVVFEDKSKNDEDYPTPEWRFNKEILTLDDLLVRNFMQTNSIMYRWRFVREDIKEIFPNDILPGDWFLHLLHAEKGKIGFIESVMSVYRRHAGGMWWESSHPDTQNNFYAKTGFNQICFYDTVLNHFKNKSKENLLEQVKLLSIKTIGAYQEKKAFDKLSLFNERFPSYFDFYKQNNEKTFQKMKNKIVKLRKQRSLLIIINSLTISVLLLILIFKIAG